MPPEPPPPTEPPPQDEGAGKEHGFWTFMEDYSKDGLLDQINELQERLAKEETAREKAEDLLQEAQDQREREWRETFRWISTSRLTIIIFATLVLISVASFIGIQLNTLLSEMRDKGERLAMIEERLEPGTSNITSEETVKKERPQTASHPVSEKRISRPGRAR